MTKERLVALTTFDNPFNPFEDFVKWYHWDLNHGYNTTGLLARFAKTSDELPDSVNDKLIEQAIDEIVDMFGREIYVKLVINDSSK